MGVPQRTPFGKWALKRAYVSLGQTADDVAVLRLYPNLNDEGLPVHIGDVVGGSLRARTSVAGEKLPDVQIHGYPGNDCNVMAGVDCESPDLPQVHRVGEISVCPTAAEVSQSGSIDVPHCMIQFGMSGGPLVIVGGGLPAGQGEAVGVVSGIQQAHLDPGVLCPLMNAADADADVVDPRSACDPDYVTSGDFRPVSGGEETRVQHP